ncbi:MAG: hypothetical protein DRP79_02145 [Planctomycetota bacterium]|nr:MAG: hypothetical protein DRP79_02145 [Planctomycetota bacterium]
MYREYWGLKEDPFSNTFDHRFFYLSRGFEEAVKRFLSAMTENRGVMLLVGPTGVGKTFLAKLIAQQLRSHGIRVAQMITPRLKPEGFAKKIGKKLQELRGIDIDTDLEKKDAEEAAPSKNGAPAVLVIDEAQTIEDAETFEVLCSLLDLDHDGKFVLTTLLSGNDSMVEHLRKIPSLNQRIGVRYRLREFNAEETSEYIRFRLKAAGATSDIFDTDALEDIHAISEGVPRIINTLCDLAMVIAADERMLRVDTEIVARARRELSSLR